MFFFFFFFFLDRLRICSSKQNRDGERENLFIKGGIFVYRTVFF